jgi:hypothetical protein
MIIRDLTGRYVWDTQLEPIMYKEPNHQVITEIDQRKLITKKDVVIEPSSKM